MAPQLEVLSSRGLPGWLAARQLSLAVTTYQAGKLLLLGVQADGRLSVFERNFPRCMGVCVADDGLWMSTLFQVWRLANALPAGHRHGAYDRVYVPRLAYTTGDLDIHDLAVEASGRVVFVNTLFSCIATLSPRASFVPCWQPPFVSRLAAEDRCHLNGLAVADGALAYATVVGRSDVADGWREHRRDGGCIYDVRSNDVVCAGLSMPHSPRVHAGRLWLLEAGTGQLGFVDLHRGQFEPVAFVPGYARGMCIVDDHAVIGLSRLRHSKTFADLPLGAALAARGAEARCGLVVINLHSGDTVEWLRFEGAIEELFDVAAIPGVRCPLAIGLQTDEILRTITIGEPE